MGGRVDPALPVVTGTERAFMSKNVSTIVAAVATLISTCVICFFVYMAVKKLKVSTQCRNALGKSGILCFHKGKVSHNPILYKMISSVGPFDGKKNFEKESVTFLLFL